MVVELWLVRHGETLWNADKRIQGQKDISLSEKGRGQAVLLAKRLSALKKNGLLFDKIYSSDLCRAYETACICFPQSSLTEDEELNLFNPAEQEILKDQRLRELNFGQFEGKLYLQLSKKERKQLPQLSLMPCEVRAPDGESTEEFKARALDWLRSLPSPGRFIAFTHGGFITTVLNIFIGGSHKNAYSDSFNGSHNLKNLPAWRFKIDNTGITKVRFYMGRYAVIETLNDVSHLELLGD
ncbi:probable phosphoglycerate mutase GpmB [Zophobas morio]|uniref:probable phosphoglycerate mutase GpmB n=1 Tax=Zophobas morio TaxID=2755281 RepID=UPI0030838DC3